MCKDEVQTYIGALEESKEKFDRELKHKKDMVSGKEGEAQSSDHTVLMKI